MRPHHQQRFERVLDYIEGHLDEGLGVERLSAVAGCSKFHFHRQFSLYTGVSVARYVQTLRLQRAARALLDRPAERVIEIALGAGFDSHEAFSRAFKQGYGQSPSHYRRQPLKEPWHLRPHLPERESTQTMEVKIVDFAATLVAVLEHRGAPTAISDSVQQFIAWRKASGLSPVREIRTFGLAYDDPAAVEPEQFRFDICGEVSAPVPENPFGVVTKSIPAGRCAVVRHHGSSQRLDPAAYYLYRDWLPQSGEELRDFPLFFHYVHFIDVPEAEQITDLYLPLA